MVLGMEKEKNSYRYAIPLSGDSSWQQVVVSPSDFKKAGGETPKDWDGLDLVISLAGGWDWQDVKMRNLTWLKAAAGNP